MYPAPSKIPLNFVLLPPIGFQSEPEISIEGNDKIPCIYGREGASKRKPLGEIGVHSVRGGTIVGEHEVIYAGLDEVFSLKHEAFSKKIFAKGALLGAKWLISKGKGMYDMEDVLFGGKD